MAWKLTCVLFFGQTLSGLILAQSRPQSAGPACLPACLLPSLQLAAFAAMPCNMDSAAATLSPSHCATAAARRLFLLEPLIEQHIQTSTAYGIVEYAVCIDYD